MFSPFRLLTMCLIGVGVYMGFYAVPSGGTDPGAFDPPAVAQYESAAWKAGRERAEMPAFLNATLYYRELHRMSWFRAAQCGFTLSRILVQIPHMSARFDRVLPGLEEIARTERAWKKASFDSQNVARQQLDWITVARTARDGASGELIVSAMSEELGHRFNLRPDQTHAAAADRGEAVSLFLTKADADWNAVSALLTSSYTNLRIALSRAGARAY